MIFSYYLCIRKLKTKKMEEMNSLMLTDGYKVGHAFMEPGKNGLEFLLSNWTPRTGKRAPEGVTKVVSIGYQLLFKRLINHYDTNFFKCDKNVVCQEFKKEMEDYLGVPYDVERFERLHDLGYLPIQVRAIEEGVEVPFGIPMMLINNTDGFGWLTNYLESKISNSLWQPMTSATIAKSYRRILEEYAKITDPENIGFVDWQAHDFSFRGMAGLDSAIGSGFGHATSFLGSDTIPIIKPMRKYYNEEGFIIGSVNATEHSIMCANMSFYVWSKFDNDWERIGDAEFETFKRLITEVFPTGILSIVSDTSNLWRVLVEFMPKLKNEIISRDGKIVIRPDSSRHTPIEVISGYKYFKDIVKDENGWYLTEDKEYLLGEYEYKGAIELLWDVFGGTISSTGYKKLHPNIGLIYGDAINPYRMRTSLENLKNKGFASTNVVFGCGSMTYQYNTRDTLGFAIKATFAIVDGQELDLFKNPITDKGFKKSARGLLAVFKDENGEYYLKEKATWDEFNNSELRLIVDKGRFVTENETTLTEIREKLKKIE